MSNKSFTVYFFTIEASNTATKQKISIFNFFKDEFLDKDITLSKPVDLNISKYQIRNLYLIDDNHIGGTLTRLRLDVPPIGSEENIEERDIDLQDGESFLEKSHFVISKQNANSKEILSFQYSIESGTVHTLSKVLQQLVTHANSIDILSIIRQDAMQRMMNGQLKYVEIVVAKPKIKDYVAEDDFSKQALDMMDNTGATKFSSKLSVQSRKKGLSDYMKDLISALSQQPQTTKLLKVKLHEVEMPIDILGDQLKTRITVEIQKSRRPKTNDMLNKIHMSKLHMENEINSAIDIS